MCSWAGVPDRPGRDNALIFGALRQEKGSNGVRIGKEKNKLLFPDDTIIYAEYPRKATDKVLELIFIMLVGSKMNIQHRTDEWVKKLCLYTQWNVIQP